MRIITCKKDERQKSEGRVTESYVVEKIWKKVTKIQAGRLTESCAV